MNINGCKVPRLPTHDELEIGLRLLAEYAKSSVSISLGTIVHTPEDGPTEPRAFPSIFAHIDDRCEAGDTMDEAISKVIAAHQENEP